MTPSRFDHFRAPKRQVARSGFTLLELVATTGLLAVVLVTFLPLMAWINAERRAAFDRQLAVEEVSNIVEQIAARPWESIAEDSLRQTAISEVATRTLKDHRLVVSVEEPSEPLNSKRVSVALDWKNRAGERVSPVRLTTWFYQADGNMD